MNEGEAYLDIVWRQFKKNRLGLFLLWIVWRIVSCGDLRALLASNVPFVFHDGIERSIPGFTRCFIRSKSSISCSTWRCWDLSLGCCWRLVTNWVG